MSVQEEILTLARRGRQSDEIALYLMIAEDEVVEALEGEE